MQNTVAVQNPQHGGVADGSGRTRDHWPGSTVGGARRDSVRPPTPVVLEPWEAPTPDPTPSRVLVACVDCQTATHVGDINVVNDQPTGPITLDGYPSFQQHSPTLAVWRMMHEHLGHDLRILAESTLSYNTVPLDDVVFVEAEPTVSDADNVTLAAYVHGWPDNPTVRHWSGRILADQYDATAIPTGAHPAGNAHTSGEQP